MAMDSLSPLRAVRMALSRMFSTTCMSASMSSVSMVPMSRIGSTEPSTCMMSGSSKQRTTWRTASTSRMWLRNLLPRPSPSLAPRTMPAMSTSRMMAAMIFWLWMNSWSVASRESGTVITPTFGSMVQKG